MAKKRDETPEERAKRIRESQEFAAFMDEQAGPRPGRVRLEHGMASRPADIAGPEPDPESQSHHDLAIAFLKEMARAEHGGDQDATAREIDRLLRAYHAELAARNDRERRRRALRHGLHLSGKPEYKVRRDIPPPFPAPPAEGGE